MKKVAITGGIGAGKSIVCNILSTMGYPIYNCDNAAKNLMNSSLEIKKALMTLFGENIYKNGELDKAGLAQLIFNNNDCLAQVNSIVHPIVKTDFSIWCTQQNKSIVFMESAILFESHFETDIDYVCTVTAPQTVRIARTMLRDGITPKQVKSRIDTQMSDSEKCRLSHFVIVNDDKVAILPQIIKILKECEK